MWTAESVRRELPRVQVQCGRKKVWARVTGRLNPFATVTVDNDAPRRGSPLWYDFQASWETLARCLNTGQPLLV